MKLFENKSGTSLFKYGKIDYIRAIIATRRCMQFKLDNDEDELVTSTEQDSCYNCLYRRWTADSFVCMGASV